jgi:hypothetical protein
VVTLEEEKELEEDDEAELLKVEELPEVWGSSLCFLI